MRSYAVKIFCEPVVEIDAADLSPKGTEVVVEVTRCGVCHSDLHIQDGYYDLGGGKRLSLADRGVNPPVIMGHEVLGRLVTKGPDAPVPDDMIGKTFVVYPWLGCGKCETCLAGEENMCRSRAARRASRRRLCRPHDGAASAISARPEGARSRHRRALCLLRRHRLQRAEEGQRKDFDTPIVIFGAGGVGLSGLALLRRWAAGARRRRYRSEKREAAEQARRARDRRSARRRMRWRQLAAKAGEPIRAGIDLVGNAQTTQLGFDCLTKGGKLRDRRPVRRRQRAGRCR